MSDEPTQNPFFSEQHISELPADAHSDIVKRRWAIVEYIRTHPNVTVYQISKGLKIGYAPAHTAMRELVFARIVYVHGGRDSQGRPVELFFLPEVTK